MERLDKILSNYGGLTRADAKQALKAGRVKVNGAVIKDPAVKAAETDEVTFRRAEVMKESYDDLHILPMEEFVAYQDILC